MRSIGSSVNLEMGELQSVGSGYFRVVHAPSSERQLLAESKSSRCDFQCLFWRNFPVLEVEILKIRILR
ncbi:MAG: hypothetical protein ACI8XW_003336 [Gammaproteobacteria bacterium]|jgi:hypothetical protein